MIGVHSSFCYRLFRDRNRLGKNKAHIQKKHLNACEGAGLPKRLKFLNFGVLLIFLRKMNIERLLRISTVLSPPSSTAAVPQCSLGPEVVDKQSITHKLTAASAAQVCRVCEYAYNII